ncbi:MAG: 1-deoxy-D-xylulose-5-phosphate synthase, partial [Clostridia bacterium]|nr:1-deoxy-D-xylulose-5-phosphate synthase [Clostridia bacterium]
MLKDLDLPKRLKNMNYDELSDLCSDIRGEIMSVVSENGGHLASNLGVVELTVALHRAFDFPEDKLIFDVGHQCYAHKILTGRADRFDTIRKKGGLSGFTNRFESEYDTLTAGHSGPSVSAGLGIAQSNKLLGKDNYVVSVVGDGSFTNGMIYEALNNCCDKSLKYIIVLNDNEMSISSNVGNLSKYFSKFRTSKGYFKFKHKLKNGCLKIPVVGKSLVKFFSAIKNFFKKIVLPNNSFFSALDMRYLGPVDGHDIEKLEDVFAEAKNLGESCLVIVKTQKGRGYSKAEKNPENYHSVGKFDISKGTVKSDSKCFSDVFGEAVVRIAKEDGSVAALTAAMCEGTGLHNFSKEFPDRFFDVGIAEEHELAFACGLAAGGMKPVCAVYSTFAQRVYDQVFHDFSVQKLPCVLALDRCGFVPDDGITHQGLFDVSLFSSVPGCTIYSPETYEELDESVDKAFDEDCVSVVRYPKGRMSEYDRSGFIY